MLRKLSRLVVALAATVAFSNASALFIMVDGFDGGPFDQTVTDGTRNGVAVVQALAGAPFSRSVSHDLLRCPGPGAFGFATCTDSFTRMGSASFDALEVNNGVLRDAQVKVLWTLPVGLVPTFLVGGQAEFYLDLLSSDSNPVSVTMLFNNIQVSPTFNVPPNTFNTVLVFSIPVVQQNAMNAGGTLELRLDGSNGWDFLLDSIGIQVPEPTSIALVGLALLGAGVLSRRRKV